MTVDPDALKTAGTGMHQSGQDLHEQWQALKEQTQALRCGGDDMISPVIQLTLMGAVAIADSCFGTSKDAMSSHQDALNNAATAYAKHEATNSSLFKA